MDQNEIEQEAKSLAKEITSAKIAQMIQEIRGEPDMAGLSTVTVYQIMKRIFEEKGYDRALQAKLAMPLREAIYRAVAQIPDMEYVDGG